MRCGDCGNQRINGGQLESAGAATADILRRLEINGLRSVEIVVPHQAFSRPIKIPNRLNPLEHFLHYDAARRRISFNRFTDCKSLFRLPSSEEINPDGTVNQDQVFGLSSSP